MLLHDKTILLTGATGGIGREIAAQLATEWSTLILVARSASNLRVLIKSLPGTHQFIAADISLQSGRKSLLSAIRRKKLKIDILINSAGIGIYKPSGEITEKEWYSSYELNVHTPFFLIQALDPTLTVNIGSCSAIQFRRGRSLYNSTKAAFRSMTLCLEQESPGRFVHLTLDSTLTDFGPLTLIEKKSLASQGKTYLSPAWVAQQITQILTDDNRKAEYVFSPNCYDNCGVWKKP